MMKLHPLDIVRSFSTRAEKIEVGSNQAGKRLSAAHRGLFSLLILFSATAGFLNVYGVSSPPDRIVASDNPVIPDDRINSTGIENQIDSSAKRRTAPNNEKQLKSTTNWSEPLLLFENEGPGEIHAPTVVSDAYGNIHVFWTVEVNRQIEQAPGGSSLEWDMIYYTRKDAVGWITPIDIITSAPARAVSVTIGKDDFIHLVWSGPGGLMYSRAPIQGAEFVKNWSKPILITPANFYADLVTSSDGTVHLAYPGAKGTGVFELSFDPALQNWTSSRLISQPYFADTSPDYVQIRIGEDEAIHVVWTEFYYPQSWPPAGVFYSNSTDGGNSWATPRLLAGDGYDQVNIAVVDAKNIHVAWNGMAGVGGRYHRWSADGGRTWSNTSEIIPAGVGGTEGLPQLVVDQRGTLHLLTTHTGGCLWYSYLNDNIWTSPVCISGERTLVEEPSMALSEGNKLHAVFWDDRQSVWYTTKETDAPWIAPERMEIDIPQPAQTIVPTLSPGVEPANQPTMLPVDSELNVSSKFSFTSSQLLLLSLAPVFLFILLVMGMNFINRKR